MKKEFEFYYDLEGERHSEIFSTNTEEEAIECFNDFLYDLLEVEYPEV